MTDRSFPFAGTALARRLEVRIEELEGFNSKRDCSRRGYDKPNVLSMFKRGETKSPLDRIFPLARALAGC